MYTGIYVSEYSVQLLTSKETGKPVSLKFKEESVRDKKEQKIKYIRL